MPDWVQYIREHLRLENLKRERADEIVEELARQLEDFYREATAHGLTTEEAEAFSKQQIPDWESLMSDLYRTNRRTTKPKIEKWHDHAGYTPAQEGGTGHMFANLLVDLRSDLLYGVRMLSKNPGFTAVAVLTLALGIGANAAIFSVVNGVLLEPLPYPEPGQLVQMWEVSEKGGRISVSYLNFHDWRDRTKSVEYMSYYTGGQTVILGGQESVRAPVRQVHRDLFSVMGIQPQIGRSFLPEKQRYNGTPEAIVSYGFWRRLLGGNPDLAGISLDIAGYEAPVVGVMPASFDFPPGTDVWIPGNIFPPPPLPPEILPLTRTGHNVRVVGRLKPGVTLAQAQAEMTTIARQLQKEYKGQNDAFDIALVSLHEQIVRRSRTPLLILLGASGLLLLLACANVANLLLARSAARRKELAIRTALGAGRDRLVRQLLAENLLLAFAGGLLGLLLARGILRILPLLSPGNIPRLDEISLDGTVLSVTMGVCFLTALLIGLAPALQISRVNLHGTLAEGGRSGGAASRNRLRSLLVVSEVALALMLLIGSGLMINSLWRLLAVDPGFRPDGVLAARVYLPAGSYPGISEWTSFQHQLFERLQAVPAVQSAGAVSSAPLLGSAQSGTFLFSDRPEEKGYSEYRSASPGYFRTMSIPLLAGRFFEEADTIAAPHVAIISESMRKKFWPQENPLGKIIFSIGFEPDSKTWKAPITIVGVVDDIHHLGLDRERRPTLYVPLAQRSAFGGNFSVMMRTGSNPLDLVSVVRQEIQAMDPNVPADFRTMETVVVRSYAGRRFQMLLIGGFAALGLVLATIGIYGVIAYSVSQRTYEIGIRMALGAQPGDIVNLILKQGLSLTILGVALGLAGAFAATRLMTSLLFGVTATDPATFVAVPVLLVTVALVACYIPARRAARVEPMVTLRYE